MTNSHSPNLSEDLKKQLEAIVPAAFKDGNLDANTLKQLLGMEIATQDERYGLNWAGKADSYKALQYPTSATLRPRQDQSVNFEHAQHVFIEGENLEVLKTLQRAYFGKVKMIYIDPPYNTGSDSFIYPDRFQESREDYLKRIESLDIDGNLTKEGLFRKNSKDNGHYHSNWLSMMLPRLYLARNLLRDDGVIFTSIDDNEASNLKLLCDEVLGEENFVANIVWQKKYSVSNDDPSIAPMHDHILAYKKSQLFERKLLPRTEKQLRRYKNLDNDPRGDWSSGEYVSSKTRAERPTLWYPIKHPKTGQDVWPDENAVWRYSKEKHEEIVKENRLYWGSNNDYDRPRLKRFISEIQDGVVPSTWWTFDLVGHNDEAQKETGELVGKKIFSTPKPVRLVKHMLNIATNKDDLILDFFAGSAATAHAVMELNLADGGNRQFICVQMAEPTDQKSEAYKAGYKTIADISRERIRRVIAQIKQKADLANPIDENNPNLGFRAFELAPSNFKQWRGDWAETVEELDKQLALMLPTEKQGAKSFDMAFELLLKNGRPLTSKVELKTFHETPVYIVWAENEGETIATLMFVLESMQLEALHELLALKPAHIVFLDSVFKNNDSIKVNVALQCETAGIKFSSI